MVMYEDAIKHGPLVGFSDLFGQRGVYVTDLDLLRNIFVKDFDHFVNRRPMAQQNGNDYFRKMLFVQESEQWKGTRAKLSPSFATSKIKRMFDIFSGSSDRMIAYIKEQLGGTGGDFDFGVAFPKYSLDVIASCAVGVESQCFNYPPPQMSHFERMGRSFQFDLKPSAMVKFLVMATMPKVAGWLGLEVLEKEPTKYFVNLVKRVMKQRRQEGSRRKDFLQLMMNAQEGLSKMNDEANEGMNGTTEETGLGRDQMEKSSKILFDDEHISANCLLFFLGGFDTTLSLLLFAVYALALEPEVQERVYDVVREKVDAHGGKVTYDGVIEMHYLDLFLQETLRVFPPVPRADRCCTKEYNVPGTNVVFEKGTVVVIPIYPVHHDPKYFRNPEKFMPERFTPENKAARHPYTFMPFGHGPRNCIATRFALTEVKAVIAQLVVTFKFSRCSKTLVPIRFDNHSNLKPKGGMWVWIESR